MVRTTSTTSPGHLVALIRATGGLSRQELIAATGMSRGTLYQRLDRLAALGLVYDAEAIEPTGGRPARRVRFEDRGRVVLAVDLGQNHARVAVTDLAGNELRRIARTATTGLDAALDLGIDLLAAGSAEQLVGVGIGVPAAVDPATGHILEPVTVPGWEPTSVVDAAARRFAVPVVVENDARAGAVGEWRAGDGTLVYVKLATGLGCGIVVDGAVLRGAGGTAGDIGHVQVSADGPRCRCGRIGCLAAYCSGRALAARLGTVDANPLALAAAVRAGDPAAVAAVEHAAEVLGAALATTVTTVNPGRLVLGGALGALPSVVAGVEARVRATVAERAWPLVQPADRGRHATTTGLARLVVEHVYAPAAVDAMV